ncbi:MAG: hypothetical protein GEV11_16830 [Streptosporangiales bacterium]|nr:hypothetical protein [Streptosporangiales bacterium]
METGGSAAELDESAVEPGGSTGEPEDAAHGLSEVLAALATGRAEGSTTAVVVPLLTGPHPRLQQDIAAAASEAATPVTVTDPLGPHPLLAGALHEQLAAKGLARADRMRMLSLVTSTDGVIIVTVGGTEAAQAADMTAVLLASRLAVPVVPAALDGDPGVEDVAARLREAGAVRPAIAPCLIGPEAVPGSLEKIAADAGMEYAEPLGAHPAIARLIALRYEVALDDVHLG